MGRVGGNQCSWPCDQSEDADGGQYGADSDTPHRINAPEELRAEVPERHRADRNEGNDGVAPAGRNGEKGPNHDGIELGAGIGRQLEASSLGGPWSVVTVDARGGVIEVSNRHDPGTERNLLTNQPERITGPVEAFMMLGNRVRPVAEPGRQWCGERRPFEWMPPHHFPFVVRQRAGLVEDVGMNLHLADIMEKGGPP
jgi:hypothetical protein